MGVKRGASSAERQASRCATKYLVVGHTFACVRACLASTRLLCSIQGHRNAPCPTPKSAWWGRGQRPALAPPVCPPRLSFFLNEYVLIPMKVRHWGGGPPSNLGRLPPPPPTPAPCSAAYVCLFMMKCPFLFLAPPLLATFRRPWLHPPPPIIQTMVDSD